MYTSEPSHTSLEYPRWICFCVCGKKNLMRAIGDVVAIYIDNKPSVYARIEGIEHDIKPRWYQVRLLFLGFPPQEMTWILKEEYLEGSLFTMKDIPMQIIPIEKPGSYKARTKKRTDNQSAEVISIDQMRVKKAKKGPIDEV